MARPAQIAPANNGHAGHAGQGGGVTPATSTAASSAAPFGLQYGLGRHRRLLRDQTRPSSSSTTFNPEAIEFVPTTPTKRKASSSALSGKSLPSGARYHMDLASAYEPIIKAKDLFGAAVTERAHNDHSAALERLIGEAALSEWEDTTPVPGATGLQLRPVVWPRSPPTTQALRSRIARVAQDAAVVDQTPQKLSVVLVSLPAGASHNGRIRYLPLCPASSLHRGHNQDTFTVLTMAADRLQADESASSSVLWPRNEMPTELFDWITQYLARDDVKSMRLVNHEFESKVSRSLFHTSVVPFNTELYDMVGDEVRAVSQLPELEPLRRDKGKGRLMPVPKTNTFLKSLATQASQASLHWKNAKDDVADKVYKGHGLRVFQGFGPHIKRFGMSFEVSENQLLQLPVKKELDHVDTYYGNYDWPPPNYTRFKDLAGLENTADQTSRMKEAFSKLEIVQELALSVDSGLGWMSGPDVSLHARVFKRPSTVFGRSHDVADHETQAATRYWDALQRSHALSSQLDPKEVSLGFRELEIAPGQLDGLAETAFADDSRWASVDALRVLPDGTPLGQKDRLGVLYTTAQQFDLISCLGGEDSVTPNELVKEQKEWLLETEWAQRAFLESYMLAVVDNPLTFEGVTRLNIAQLSSGFLPIIARQHFWDALPSLQDVTLQVSPHWRSVAKDKAGIAETTTRAPSGAVNLFYGVLRTRLSTIETLRKLNIGWVDGGEHAQGMFARNANLLPAPITQLEQCMGVNAGTHVLTFKHIEELTLSNCWMTPVVLEALVSHHESWKLKKLTLNSISLTAHPRFNAPAQPAPPAQAAVPALNAQQLMIQAGMANPAPPGLVQQQIHNVQIQNVQHAQHMAQLQQQMQQQMQHVVAVGVGAGPWANQPLWAQQMAAQFVPLGAPAGPGNPHQPQQQQHVNTDVNGYRDGSWPSILNRISPRAASTPPPQDEWDDTPLPAPPTLKMLSLISCGYTHLNNVPFDQTTIESSPHVQSQWFRLRQAALKPCMLECKEKYLGFVVQHMPQGELDTLLLAWQLREGWEDAGKAEEPQFDGHAKGGTGRVTGNIEAAD